MIRMFILLVKGKRVRKYNSMGYLESGKLLHILQP